MQTQAKLRELNRRVERAAQAVTSGVPAVGAIRRCINSSSGRNAAGGDCVPGFLFACPLLSFLDPQ